MELRDLAPAAMIVLVLILGIFVWIRFKRWSAQRQLNRLRRLIRKAEKGQSKAIKDLEDGRWTDLLDRHPNRDLAARRHQVLVRLERSQYTETLNHLAATARSTDSPQLERFAALAQYAALGRRLLPENVAHFAHKLGLSPEWAHQGVTMVQLVAAKLLTNPTPPNDDEFPAVYDLFTRTGRFEALRTLGVELPGRWPSWWNQCIALYRSEPVVNEFINPDQYRVGHLPSQAETAMANRDIVTIAALLAWSRLDTSVAMTLGGDLLAQMRQWLAAQRPAAPSA